MNWRGAPTGLLHIGSSTDFTAWKPPDVAAIRGHHELLAIQSWPRPRRCWAKPWRWRLRAARG